MKKKPIFIVIEGLDGSGKTTTVSYIDKLLRNNDRKVCILRGMGTGSLGNVVRAQLFYNYFNQRTSAVACGLALLDCYNHIKQALDNGYDVICDRFIGTYYGYNITANNDLGASNFFKDFLDNPEFIDVLPDLTIFLDVEIEVAKKFLKTRNEDLTIIDKKSDEYFNSVRSGLNIFIDQHKNHNPIIIKNDSTIEVLEQQLQQIIEEIA